MRLITINRCPALKSVESIQVTMCGQSYQSQN